MSWNKKIIKFWILLLSNYREDSHRVMGIAMRYIAIIFLCGVYRYLFSSGLLKENVLFNGRPMPYSLFVMSGFAALYMLYRTTAVAQDTLLSLKKSQLLEWVVISHSDILELFMAKAAWNFLLGLTEAATFILSGHILFAMPLRPYLNPFLFFAALIVFITYAGIGVLLSSLNLLFHRSKSLTPVINQLSILLGGLFFPVDVFPRYLKLIAECMPITHCLRWIRVLITGIPIADSLTQMGSLTLITSLILSFSIIIFKKSLSFAKKNDILFDDK